MDENDQTLQIIKRNGIYTTNLMNKARQEFYTQFVEENSSNQEKLFNAAKKLLGELQTDALSWARKQARVGKWYREVFLYAK